MQASILQLPMLAPICRPPEAAAPAAASTDLLSQCTTEWSRYFIASRIAPCARYTAALTADLRPQLQPEHSGAGVSSRSHQRSHRPHPPALLSLLADDAADSPGDSGRGSEVGGDDSPAEPSDSPTSLRKLGICSDMPSERLHKRVQFADEVGQALTRVKLLSISEPVNLQYETYASSADYSLCQQQQQQQQQTDWSGPQLKCRFSQPSAKYIVFRETLERNLVSLSLVHLDPGAIRGSIAVKNISFRKRVFVRVSFDSWHSFQDVEAAYNGSEGLQDNFAFNLRCPRDQPVDVQFCVCFDCDSGTFWDNNGGENYRIGVSQSAAASACGYTRDFKPDYRGVSEFSEFSAWEHFDDRVYY